jgi:hypothetical protein
MRSICGHVSKSGSSNENSASFGNSCVDPPVLPVTQGDAEAALITRSLSVTELRIVMWGYGSSSES